MGTLVNRVSATPIRIGFHDLHLSTSAYKPTGRANVDDGWHKKFVAPSERAWAKKNTSDRHNVYVVQRMAPQQIRAGDPVFRIDHYAGQRVFNDDFGTHYPQVGEVRRLSNGKLYVEIND